MVIGLFSRCMGAVSTLAAYDNIPIADKKLQWIEGTTARWDGYLEFQRRPQPMLDFFAQHMSVAMRSHPAR